MAGLAGALRHRRCATMRPRADVSSSRSIENNGPAVAFRNQCAITVGVRTPTPS